MNMHKKIISFNDIYALDKLGSLSKEEKRAKLLDYKKMLASIEKTKDNVAQMKKLNKEIEDKLGLLPPSMEENVEAYLEACKKYGVEPNEKFLEGLKEELTSIELKEENVGDAGAKAIAETLRINQTITSLDLELNEINTAGAEALAEALENNQTLSSLELYNNQLGDAGAKAMAKALKHNKTITLLDLGGNEIGDAGAEAIAEALKTNKIITSLVFWMDIIGPAGYKALTEANKARKAKGLPKVKIMKNANPKNGREFR
jgi:predicted HicB family RNase H-like nuclease